MKNIVIIIAIIFSISVYSQEKTYKLIDSKTSLPISYANIYNKNFGTITNSNGMFELNLNNIKDSLTISHIGYEKIKISLNELKKKIEINLTQKETKLEEIVIYSIDNILDKIINSLKINYPDFPTNEFFFSRLTLLKNKNEGQLSEGYINVKKSHYFDHSKNKLLQISLLSNRKINNLENIDFKYLSYQKLFKLSESFINLKNGYYNFTYTNIGNEFLKITFFPKDNIDPYETIFNGYLIINKINYAIIEFSYSVDSMYKKYLPEIEIKSNIYKKDISSSKLVKWVKNSKDNKYELSYFRIEDKLSLKNNNDSTKDIYTAIYELQNMGYIDNYYLPQKVHSTKSKKNVFEYSSFNLKSKIWKIKHPLIKNKKQNNLLKIIHK